MRERIRLLLRSTTVSLLVILFAPLDRGSAAFGQPADEVATIGGLNCDRRGNAALVSFRVLGAFGPELRSSLDGGQTVTFTHEIQLTRHRALWFSKQVASMKIESSATFDTLTQRFVLTRRVDDGVRETSSTDRASDAERWLSEVDRVKVPLGVMGAGGTLDAKVKSVYGHDFLLFLLPWQLNAKDHAECR